MKEIHFAATPKERKNKGKKKRKDRVGWWRNLKNCTIMSAMVKEMMGGNPRHHGTSDQSRQRSKTAKFRRNH